MLEYEHDDTTGRKINSKHTSTWHGIMWILCDIITISFRLYLHRNYTYVHTTYKLVSHKAQYESIRTTRVSRNAQLFSCVSQGSVATNLRGGGSFNSCFFCRSFLNVAVKKIRELVHVYRSYHKSKTGTCVWDTV